MPAVLYLGALGLITVGGICMFAWEGLRELADSTAATERAARETAVLLEKRRGQFVSLYLYDTKSVKGWVVSVEPTHGVVFLDVRRAGINEDGVLRPKAEVPGPEDLSAVELDTIERVTAYGGMSSTEEEEYANYEFDDGD